MRLDAITGSMVDLKPANVAQGVAAASFAAADLKDVLAGYAQAITNIHGNAEFTNQVPGRFEHATAQFTGSIESTSHISASMNMKAGGGLEVAGLSDLHGNVHMFSNAQVDGLSGGNGSLVYRDASKVLTANASLKFNGTDLLAPSAMIADLTSDRIVFAGLSGSLVDSDKLTFNGSDLIAASAQVSDLTATRVVYAGASGALVDSANMTFDGTDLTVASAKVSDLTDGRVVYAGASGALVDSSEMTFGAGGLTLAKDLSARSGSYSGDVTISGNLNVMGATTTIDTQNLLVKDAKIVVSSGGIVDGAGLYLADDSAGENIRWATADGGKWIASDKFAADTLQALDLSEAIVYADASGNLVEITATQFAGYLSAGFGISSVTTGTIVATEYTPGTGMHKAGFEFSIGQPVETTSVVTFAAVTGSNLTAARLMASDANKVMVSADLAAWVAGTANQITVTDDLDGSITLSLPQNIDTNADVEFDTLKLGDYAADAGKAYMVGTSGSIVPAAWDQFVSIEANVGLELIQDGFKAQIGLAQDIRTSASPEFAALNLGSYGDLLASGSDFKIQAAADLFLVDAQGGFKLSEVAGDWTSYVANFGNVSLVEALNSLAGGSVAGKGKWVKAIAADVANGQYTFIGDDALVGSSAPALGAAPERTEIYLNGQLMVAGADYTVTGAMVDFTFGLKADDVIVAVIR
jgi:hypothetical protein